jgi:hypothetical protein
MLRQKRASTKKIDRNRIVREELRKTQTMAETNFILRKKIRPALWTEKEIVRGLVLRTLSMKAYKYLRRAKIMPLPGISTLRRWIKGFQVKEGIQHDTLHVLRRLRESNSSPYFKLSVLSFDEMKVAESVTYEARADQVFGTHRQAQVAMIRGLTHTYKQPIYAGFDKTMTIDLLTEVICAVENEGFHIVAVVSDMGSTNQTLFRKMGITESRPFFDNPADHSRRIFVLHDVPHLVKLARNHLLDKGYILPGGETLMRQDLEELLTMDCGEFRLAHKLKPSHFSVQGNERQRVFPAVQELNPQIIS